MVMKINIAVNSWKNPFTIKQGKVMFDVKMHDVTDTMEARSHNQRLEGQKFNIFYCQRDVVKVGDFTALYSSLFNKDLLLLDCISVS